MTLVIFKVNQLGDNVVFLPVVQMLRQRLVGWRVVVLTSTSAAQLYETACPGVEVNVHETLAFNRAWRSPRVLARLLQEVRALGATACLLGDDQGSVAHLLAKLSGAKSQAGPNTSRVRLNALIRSRVPALGLEHVAEHNWRIASELLTGLGLLPPNGGPPPPDLSAFGREEHGAVVIHPGASREYKRWPLADYVALANHLIQKHPVIWFEQEEAGAEQQALSPLIRRVKTNTLDGLIRLLAGAKHFVGNNSGPMNLASALGVPGTIFMGPSTANWAPAWHRDRFDLLRDATLPCQPCDDPSFPVNICQNKREPMICMRRWRVEEVALRILARLER